MECQLDHDCQTEVDVVMVLPYHRMNFLKVLYSFCRRLFVIVVEIKGLDVVEADCDVREASCVVEVGYVEAFVYL